MTARVKIMAFVHRCRDAFQRSSSAPSSAYTRGGAMYIRNAPAAARPVFVPRVTYTMCAKTGFGRRSIKINNNALSAGGGGGGAGGGYSAS